MLKLLAVVDKVNGYLNLDEQLFTIHTSSVITFLPKKRFFVMKRKNLRVVVICFLRNFNTTKLPLFRGCVPKIKLLCKKIGK